MNLVPKMFENFILWLGHVLKPSRWCCERFLQLYLAIGKKMAVAKLFLAILPAFGLLKQKLGKILPSKRIRGFRELTKGFGKKKVIPGFFIDST